jgi:hypothetical protein
VDPIINLVVGQEPPAAAVVPRLQQLVPIWIMQSMFSHILEKVRHEIRTFIGHPPHFNVAQQVTLG